MAVGDVHAFPGFLTPVLTLISFQSHRLLFSHASAEVRGENTQEKNFDSTGSRTHNHQVMSPTRSPLRHPGGAPSSGRWWRFPHSYNVFKHFKDKFFHLKSQSISSLGVVIFFYRHGLRF